MITPASMAAFSDEMQKSAAFTRGQAAVIGAGGLAAGALGKDMLQDAREGKVARRQREFQQKQLLKQTGFMSKFRRDGGM